MAAARQFESAANPACQFSSSAYNIASWWRQLPAKPTELQLGKWKHPRTTPSIPAELVLARADHDTDGANSNSDDSVSTNPLIAIDVAEQISSSTTSANAPKRYGPLAASSCSSPAGREYAAEYGFKHGIDDEQYNSGDRAANSAATADCMAN